MKTSIADLERFTIDAFRTVDLADEARLHHCDVIEKLHLAHLDRPVPSVVTLRRS